MFGGRTARLAEDRGNTMIAEMPPGYVQLSATVTFV